MLVLNLFLCLSICHLCRSSTGTAPQAAYTYPKTYPKPRDPHNITIPQIKSVARLTRVLRVMRTWRVMDQQHVSKTARQCGQLILTVITLVFVSAGLVQMVEVRDGRQEGGASPGHMHVHSHKHLRTLSFSLTHILAKAGHGLRLRRVLHDRHHVHRRVSILLIASLSLMLTLFPPFPQMVTKHNLCAYTRTATATWPRPPPGGRWWCPSSSPSPGSWSPSRSPSSSRYPWRKGRLQSLDECKQNDQSPNPPLSLFPKHTHAHPSTPTPTPLHRCSPPAPSTGPACAAASPPATTRR